MHNLFPFFCPGRQPQPPYPQSSPYPVAQTSMPTPYGGGAYRQQSPQTGYPQPQGGRGLLCPL